MCVERIGLLWYLENPSALFLRNISSDLGMTASHIHGEDESQTPFTVVSAIHSFPSRKSSQRVRPEPFKPDWSLYLALGTLSIIGLAASLDGTSISPALSV